MAYGSVWVTPLVMGVWGDGNYTWFEVLLHYGVCDNITRVVVNGVDVWRTPDDTDSGHRLPGNTIFCPTSSGPLNANGTASAAAVSGNYWKTINAGYRDSTPSPAPGWGRQGDPYGSLAAIWVQCLNELAPSTAIPEIYVLLEAAPVRAYTVAPGTYGPDDPGIYQDNGVLASNNMAWILMDLLLWANWSYEDMDIQSFMDAAAICGGQIFFNSLTGIYTNTYPSDGGIYQRYAGGIVVQQRTSVGELIRSVRNAMKAMLFFDYATGLLKVMVKGSFADQQPSPVPGSNYNTAIPSVTREGIEANGYAAYSFDHTNIIKDSAGKSSLTITQRANADSPNKVQFTFLDRENAYSQDSATIVDEEDVSRLGQEVYGSFSLLGPQDYDYLNRITGTYFAENYRGNPRLNYEGSAIGDTGGTIFYNLQTSIKGIHLMVGQLCLVSDQQSGTVLQRARIVSIKPSANFEMAQITLNFHYDNWYADTFGQINQPIYARPMSLTTRPPYNWRADFEVPMAGDAYFDPTDHSFGVQAQYFASAAGAGMVNVNITGKVPVNTYPTIPGPPTLQLVGEGETGGGYPIQAGSPSASFSIVLSALSAPLGAPVAQPGSVATVTIVLADAAGIPTIGSFWPQLNVWTNSSVAGISVGNLMSITGYTGAYAAFNGIWPIFSLSDQGGGQTLIVLTVQIPTSVTGNSTQVAIGVVSQVLASTGTMSQPSQPCVVSIDGAEDALSFTVLNWPNSPSGYVAFAGTNPTAMTFQESNFQSASFAAPDTLTLTNSYNVASWGAPDPAFSQFRWRVRLLYHAGVWGQEIVAATDNSLTISVPGPPSAAFTPSQWVGREVAVLGIQPKSTPSYYPIANFPISGNDTATLMLASGNPLTCISGGPLEFGDVVVMRIKPTFGQDLVGFYFDDPLWVNALEPAGLAPGQEVGRIAFIIAGTGRGTWANIIGNTTTRIYVSAWPVAPDSTTRIIIVGSEFLVDQPSNVINNSVPELLATYAQGVANFEAQSIFVQVATQSSGKQLSMSVLDPYREMYIWGMGGTREIEASAQMLFIDGLVVCDATAGPIVYTCLPFLEVLNQQFTVVKLDSGPNTVTVLLVVDLDGTQDEFDDGTTSVVLVNQGDSITFKVHA